MNIENLIIEYLNRVSDSPDIWIKFAPYIITASRIKAVHPLVGHTDRINMMTLFVGKAWVTQKSGLINHIKKFAPTDFTNTATPERILEDLMKYNSKIAFQITDEYSQVLEKVSNKKGGIFQPPWMICKK